MSEVVSIVRGMKTTEAQHLADQLRANRITKRRAEADELRLVSQLAVGYHLDTEDEVHEALYEQDLRVGGEGCPLISEWFGLELAGLLGCTTRQAVSLTGRALNLRYRHPTLWTAVQQLQVDPHRAAAAAGRCESLPREVADALSTRWLKQQHRLSWTASMNLIDKLIIEAAPQLAAEEERRALEARHVSIYAYREGSMQVSAQLDVLDAKYLDAAIEQIAALLPGADPTAAGVSKAELRARALGALAHPAYALALQQQAAGQPALLDAAAPGPIADQDPDAERHRPHPAGCTGHTCGTITTPLEKLRPVTQVFVHIPAASLAGLNGPARVEGAGSLTQDTLRLLLGDKQVVVRPVIDLPEIPAEDPYRPSHRLREAVIQIFPTDAFPYSQTPSRGLQQDHTVAYRASGPPGQTWTGNLAPLRTRIHRAKTAGHWLAHLQSPGCALWRSPLGYLYRVTPHGTVALN